MANQEWTQQGTYLANALLSKKIRKQAQPEYFLRTFTRMADPQESFGKKKGDTVNFTKFSNLASDGASLTETEGMPKTTMTIVKDTLTIGGYGMSVPYSEKIELLSSFNMENQYIQALKDGQVKHIDTLVEAQLDATSITYYPSSATAGSFTTNGTPGGSAASNMNAYHWKTIVDYLKSTLKCPRISGNYFAILTVSAHRGIHDSLEDVWKYTRYAVNGEAGSYYKCRAIEYDGDAMDNTIGTSSVTGEAYFFGSDAVMEAVALPEEIRYDSKEFGTDLGVAWIAYLGFKRTWGGDPDWRIIKWSST